MKRLQVMIAINKQQKEGCARKGADCLSAMSNVNVTASANVSIPHSHQMKSNVALNKFEKTKGHQLSNRLPLAYLEV